MAKTRPPYTPEFRRQMVELVQAGRSPDELAREFEPTAQSIRNWVAQAERDAGHGDNGLTTAEREELNRLRRENRQLRLERDCFFADRSAPCRGIHMPHGVSPSAVSSTVLVLFSSYSWFPFFLSPRASANGTSRMAMPVSGMYVSFTNGSAPALGARQPHADDG
jgi:transposase